MKRSLHADGPANDWFSDALTPVSIKRARRKNLLAAKELPPTEEDEVSDSEVVKENTTMADHMDLVTRYERMTE